MGPGEPRSLLTCSPAEAQSVQMALTTSEAGKTVAACLVALLQLFVGTDVVNGSALKALC
eukprot:1219331-Amphidinium_carterae.1